MREPVTIEWNLSEELFYSQNEPEYELSFKSICGFTTLLHSTTVSEMSSVHLLRVRQTNKFPSVVVIHQN